MEKHRLSDIAEIQIGKTPSRSNNDYWGVGTDWLSIADLNNLDNGKYISRSSEQITALAIKNAGCKLIPENSILYSFKLSIGKTAITTKPFFTNEAIAALSIRDSSQVSTDYLFYALKFANVSGLVDHAAKGKTLNKESLARIEIAVPDLKYQALTVSIFDKLQNILTKKNNSIELVEAIIRSKYIELFGDPITNPLNTKEVSLEDLGHWQTGGTPPRKVQKYFKGNIPWYSSGELNDVYTKESDENISALAIKETSAKLVKEGSLLIGMYDTAALKSSIARTQSSCNQAIAFAELNKEICDSLFVYYTIQLAKEYYLSQRRGARQKNLNLSIIKAIKIPLPEFELQKRFANAASALLQLSDKQTNSLEGLRILFNSIVYKVFNGELQNDEEIQILLRDKLKQQLLIDQLNTQDFETLEQYDLSKRLLFQLLKDTSGMVRQYFIPKTNLIQLQMADETN